MLANRMMMCQNKRRIDRSTPATIKSEAANLNHDYTGRGNIVRLSNGWLVVTFILNSNIYFYKSTDYGTTWSQLCYKSVNPAGMSIVSNGTMIYCVYTIVNHAILYTLRFDATTQQNIDLTAISFAHGGNGSMCGLDLILDNTGVLHVAWNISDASVECAKSTDWGTTWTKHNGSSVFGGTLTLDTYNEESILNVAITLTNSNLPVIGCILSKYYPDTETYEYGPRIRRFTGTDWASTQYFLLYSGIAQHCTFITSPDGVLHFVYSAETGYQIRYIKSIDNGVTWSANPITLVNSVGVSNPDIIADANSNLWLYYNRGGDIKAIFYTKNTDTWGSELTILANSGTSLYTPRLCHNYKDFLTPLCIYDDSKYDPPAHYTKFMGVWNE